MGYAVVPLKTKLEALKPLIGTKHVTDWESKFLNNVVTIGLARLSQGIQPRFTDNQIDTLDQIYNQHFGR